MRHFNHKLQNLNGGLKNQEKISQFCTIAVSFPTIGASFKQKNHQNWTLIHQDFLSVNKFINCFFWRIYQSILLSLPVNADTIKMFFQTTISEGMKINHLILVIPPYLKENEIHLHHRTHTIPAKKQYTWLEGCFLARCHIFAVIVIRYVTSI